MGLFKPFLIVVLVLLFFSLVGLIFDKTQVTNFLIKSIDKLFYIFENERTYKTQVSIVEQKNASELFLGFTADNLEFGIIPSGSVSKRFLNLANDNEEDYKILLIASGNISPMIKFDKNDFVLTKDENTSVTVFLDSSLAPKPGNYTGEVSVVSKRPKFLFLNSFGSDVK